MRTRTVAAVILFILLSTILPSGKITISKFNLDKIEVENNFLLNDNEVIKLLSPIYDKNLIFLQNAEIERLLMQNSYIDSFRFKKKYPNTIKVKIFEKKPIAILIDKKEKFFLSDQIDLIKYDNIKEFQNLPIIIGNKNEFKIFFNKLKTINFPFNLIKKYTFYSSRRWDLETINNKTIKLPSKDYIQILQNFLSLKNKKNFEKYTIFDYRIENQLILK